MISIERYATNKKSDWDNFVKDSKNGVFLFQRDYIEYHSNRFSDFSLMIYNNGELFTVLPANIDSDCLVSHGGLTYGGFVTNMRMKIPLMLKIFDATIEYLKAEKIKRIIYKKCPYIYHSFPSDEDLYALFRKGASLVRRDVSSTVYLGKLPAFQKNRIRAIMKAKLLGLNVKECNDLSTFWGILQLNLARKYHKEPVHSLQEIKNLKKMFPKNIRLFASYKDDIMLAGILIYESNNAVHAQYIARDLDNEMPGATDILFSYLIKYYSFSKNYFDFGISTEQEGLYLNEDLVSFKEGFGARSITHDFYEVDVNG